MALRIYCPSCSSEVRTDSNLCPSCGHVLEDFPTQILDTPPSAPSTTTSSDSIDNARFVPGTIPGADDI